MDPLQMVILGTATAISSIITSGTAVGSGVFLLPLLALAFPPKLALGLGAPIMLVGNLVGLKIYWGEWDDWRDLSFLIFTATVGVALGTCLINIIPNHLFKLGIGTFVISFSLYELVKNSPALDKLRAKRNACPGGAPGKAVCAAIGFLGGMATALAHAGGTVWSTYYVRRKLDKRHFVGTLILIFSLSNTFKILAYLQIGILSTEAILIVLAMSPVVILSGMIGNMLNKRVDPALFRKAVLLFILAAGIGLIVSG